MAALPPEPNLRHEALQNLRANAVEIGDYASQRRLILQELKSAKLHYSYAVRGYSSYYKRKYAGFFPKLRAGLRLAGLHISDLVWGHGEKPSRLLWSCLFFLCVLTLINFWAVMPKVGWADSHGGLKPLEYVARLFLEMSTNERFQGYVVIDLHHCAYEVRIYRPLHLGALQVDIASMKNGKLIAVYVFGSVGRGQQDSLSDLDLLAIVKNGSGKVPESSVVSRVPDAYRHAKAFNIMVRR